MTLIWLAYFLFQAGTNGAICTHLDKGLIVHNLNVERNKVPLDFGWPETAIDQSGHHFIYLEPNDVLRGEYSAEVGAIPDVLCVEF